LARGEVSNEVTIVIAVEGLVVVAVCIHAKLLAGKFR
jgi:hypothetical protein